MSIKGHGMLTKGPRMSPKLQVKSVVDEDADSDCLQNRYVQTESHFLQSTANDIGRLVNDHLSPSEVTQAIGRLLSVENGLTRHFLVLSTSSNLERENDCLKLAEGETKALHVELCPDKTHAY